MHVTKVLAGIMLVLTLGLGVLLAQVVGERNTAQVKLEATEKVLDKTEKLIEKKEKLIEQKDDQIDTCVASLEVQRKALRDTLMASELEKVDSDKRVDNVLADLPSKIKQDRTYQTLADTNRWVKELVQ